MKISDHFLLLSLIFLGSCSKITSKQETTQERPNIIYIFSDDHSTKAISAYQNGVLAKQFPDLTPNIDRLAKEGMIMNNTFCTNAICGPSRAAILTGKFSHVNGFYKNESGGDFDGSQQTFPKLLQKEGYQTAVVGKWHLGTAPTGFDYSKVMINHGGQGTYFNTVFLENGTDTLKEEKFHSSRQVWEDAHAWLDQKRDKKKPFMLMYQFKAPHRPWEPDPEFADLFKDIEIAEPATFNDTYEGRLAAADTWQTIERNLNRQDLKVHPENPENLTKAELKKWYSEGNNNDVVWAPNNEVKMEGQQLKKWKYQRYIKDYLRCVKGVDHYIGELLKYLDDNGLAENTIVIYSSDQGFYLGEHGWFDKRMMYEESLRMPFIVRYPNHIQPGSVSQKLSMNIDVAPTLLAYAGAEIPKDIQGKSIKPILEGEPVNDWRDAVYYHYYEFPWWHHVQPHYGVRTEKYKLINFYYNPEKKKGELQNNWELFDLEKDPNELTNLYGKEGYEEITAQLKERLTALQKEYNEDTPEEMMRKTDVRIKRVYETPTK
ncbi:sulfatase family protein [Flammeovirga agarivorans]|uniref:Sulfatase n=1 Tax=Flammeovirga agarivorans TaxID=2726742 RepID=A0A7X8SKA8_9BACT|nr:sulfatase [Flammeovirga agarivorans]NLR91702.1 sulfatase [Flammeovirga agarivorans]